MLAQEQDIDAHALRKQGWTITAIANHLGRDRTTIRSYPNGERTAGVRATSVPNPFEPFAANCTERLKEDPHLWASALFDEVVALGYGLSYQSFTRGLRTRQLRPAREQAHRRRAGRSRSSTTRRGRRPSGTGSSCPTRRGTGTATAGAVPTCRGAEPLLEAAWHVG